MTTVVLQPSRIGRLHARLIVVAAAACRRLRKARADAGARRSAAVAARRMRRALAGLDDHLLADIGLQRDQLADPGAAPAACGRPAP